MRFESAPKNIIANGGYRVAPSTFFGWLRHDMTAYCETNRGAPDPYKVIYMRYDDGRFDPKMLIYVGSMAGERVETAIKMWPDREDEENYVIERVPWINAGEPDVDRVRRTINAMVDEFMDGELTEF